MGRALDIDKLNPPQRAAVIHGAGPLLVLAGAGSGKTRVITYRIAHLLQTGIPPQAVAALTFTNKAAEEMRERISHLVGDRKIAGKLTMGTFHSLGLTILKQERVALGFPRGFVIYDTSDQLGVIRELLRTVQVGDRRFDVKAILTRISLAKSTFVTPDAYQPADNDEYDQITAELYPRYQEALRSYAAVDFDDLITEPVRLFETNPAVRDRWQSKFHHVLVDEYQDTNKAQLMLVKHLVMQHHNLCVVGDDDQSIYSWRGADPTNILNFDQMFAGAVVVKLEQNYRSTPTILNAANTVIANNQKRHGKVLWSSLEDGEKIVHAVASDVEAEAKFVAREIETMRVSDNWRYKDFAVLYRSNLQTKVLEEELRTAHIPYVMYGGQQFFERKEVKDLIGYLRLALNERDEIALRRVVNYPTRGIGAGTLERVASRSQAEHVPMWTILARAHDTPELARPSTLKTIAGFVSLVSGVRADLDAGKGVVAIARKLIDDIDLYGDLKSATGSASAAQRRIDNVESLLRSLERHEQRQKGLQALAQYLHMLSLASDSDSEQDVGNKVILTTLHGAKGLEFPIVFMVGMEEEILPHARTLNPQASDVFDLDHATDVSEERRLMYVGITRAQKKLYLTRTALRSSRGKATRRTPSRFLLEIPQELVVPRDIDAEARAPVGADEVRAFFQNMTFD